MSLVSQALLAASYTDLEIALLVCVFVLCAAVLALSIVLLCVKLKKRNAQPQTKPSPVIIYETKRVEVEKKAEEPEAVPVVEEVKEEPSEAVEEVAATEDVKAVEKPAVVEDDSEYAMRYNRSFRARLIQSDDEIKEWYATLKNGILAYNKVSSRISWKQESFSYRRNPVAKLFIKGKTLYLYLPLNAADYTDTKYKLEDVSKVAQFADTPALYKLKSERRIKYALDLVDEVCTKLGSQKTEREPVDYYEPYNSDVALIKKGLVKRVIEDAKKSFIGASGFSKAQDSDTDFDDKK